MNEQLMRKQEEVITRTNAYAVRFLARNAQPYLFVFEDFPDLNIPNTTNLLENKFNQLKQKLGCHHGMNRQNKILFIKDFLSAR